MCGDAAAAEHFFSCWFVVTVGWKYRGIVNSRYSGQAVVARLGSTMQASALSCKASIIREKQRKRGRRSWHCADLHLHTEHLMTHTRLIDTFNHTLLFSQSFLFLPYVSLVQVFLTLNVWQRLLGLHDRRY